VQKCRRYSRRSWSGIVTEKLYFFVAPTTGCQLGDGGGVAAEGEDIETLELDMMTPWLWWVSGEIKDGKTLCCCNMRSCTCSTQCSLHICNS